MFSDINLPKNKAAIVLILMMLLFCSTAAAETFTGELNSSFYIPGLEDPTYGAYGYSCKFNYILWSNRYTAFTVGAEQSFHWYNLSGDISSGGDQGFSSDFGLYGLLGQTFYPFSGKRFYTGIELFLGWNRLYMTGTVDRKYLKNSTFSDSSHFFNWGPIIKIGSMVTPRLGIHGFIRIPLKGLTDGDSDGLFNGDIAGPDTKIYAGTGCLIKIP